MMTSREVLNKLLRLALGSETITSLPDVVNWKEVMDLSIREGVAALALDGLQVLYDSVPDIELTLDSASVAKYEWLAFVLTIENTNRMQDNRSAELTRLFAKAGFRSCILKGQGNSLLYPNPEHRQCGDIDIWVEGGREQVLNFLRNNYVVRNAVVHHADVEIFPDVAVEVHYLPAWLYNPCSNKKLQKFFDDESDEQFENKTQCGFSVPSVKFNLVYSAVHIYKHVFQKEFTLKQLVDYFFALQHSSEEDRYHAMVVLEQLKLGKFVSWLMGKLEQELGMTRDLALCEASYGPCRRPLGELVSIVPWKIWHWFAKKSF